MPASVHVARQRRRRREVDVVLQEALVGGAVLSDLGRRRGGRVLQAVDGLAADPAPVAVEVVERVVLLVDDDEVRVSRGELTWRLLRRRGRAGRRRRGDHEGGRPGEEGRRDDDGGGTGAGEGSGHGCWFRPAPTARPGPGSGCRGHHGDLATASGRIGHSPQTLGELPATRAPARPCDGVSPCHRRSRASSPAARAPRSSSSTSSSRTLVPAKPSSLSRRAGSATPTSTTARAGSTTTSRSCSATRRPGVVEAVGDGVTEVSPGDFVVLNWRAVCGRCRACAKGEPWYCFDTANATQKMTLVDGTELSPALGIGAFVEKTLVAAGQCTKVDPDADPAAVGLLGCGIMAGFGAAVNTGGVQPRRQRRGHRLRRRGACRRRRRGGGRRHDDRRRGRGRPKAGAGQAVRRDAYRQLRHRRPRGGDP